MLFFSVIIPVFNRPNEVDELLQSLTRQSNTNFEVIVVEDGSTVSCKEITEKYTRLLHLTYLFKPNSGPGPSRNYGSERCQGDYFILLDSDCILPPHYFNVVGHELQTVSTDAFGGPDRAHESFTTLQKAINYSMTSFFTTGGIRGGKKKMDVFYPRSFNMGVRREVYHLLGGFSDMRFGEDIDFSIRILKSGYSCRFFPEAWVFHKRRTDLKTFFQQVYHSGIARIHLYKRYPESLKFVHVLPAIVTLGIPISLLVSVFTSITLIPIALYALFIVLDATWQTKNLKIGIYSVAAAFVQLIGYGTGFLRAWLHRCMCRRKAGLGEK